MLSRKHTSLVHELVYDLSPYTRGFFWPLLVIDGGDVYKDVLNPAYDTHKDGIVTRDLRGCRAPRSKSGMEKTCSIFKIARRR